MSGLIESYRRKLRSARFLLFRSAIQGLPRPLRVLDLGGTESFWADLAADDRGAFQVTLLNSHHRDHSGEPTHAIDWIRAVRGYAQDFHLWDLDRHDLVFSNSLLEHLPDRETQARVADRVERSGKPYFMQVPDRMFPVDPHFPSPFVPFFACYPRFLQARLLTLGALGSGSRSPDYETATQRLQFYTPLGIREMRAWFPSAAIRRERTLGLSRSIIAHRV